MLQNTKNQFTRPKRIVVVGSTGFIGQNFIRLLENGQYSYIGINSQDVDLTHPSALNKVQALIQEDDVVVFLSALTPRKGRNLDVYMKNIKMLSNFISGIADTNIAQFVYMSSDAVYSFAQLVISENTPTGSTDYYSLMHHTREFIVKREFSHKALILRPTMVYGFDDTHNAYGPNRFIRQALQNNTITLGGNGEDTRDYILISDLCQIILLSLGFTTLGTLNIASGQSISGMELARLIQKQLSGTEIVTTPRTQEITHREFDISALRSLFNHFSLTKIEDAIQPDNLKKWL